MGCNLVWNRSSDLKSWLRFQTRNVRHEVQLALDTSIINSQKFSQSNKDFFSLYKYVIDPVLSWFYKKLQKLSFIFL